MRKNRQGSGVTSQQGTHAQRPQHVKFQEVRGPGSQGRHTGRGMGDRALSRHKAPGQSEQGQIQLRCGNPQCKQMSSAESHFGKSVAGGPEDANQRRDIGRYKEGVSSKNLHMVGDGAVLGSNKQEGLHPNSEGPVSANFSTVHTQLHFLACRSNLGLEHTWAMSSPTLLPTP